MTRQGFLGEFEQLVLLSIAQLGASAYGMRIQEMIADRSGRDVAIGSVYGALDRLQGKGYLTSELGEPTAERGGRAKRFFALSPAGLEALQRTRSTLEGFWSDLDLDTGARP